MAVMDYINELKNQRNLLADILSEKGVEASRSEKFNTLIPKVRDISGSEFKFSETNLLTGITFFDSKYATTVKDGNKVRVTFNSANDVIWYSLTGAIPFNIEKFYKLSINNWNGYGRLGINKTYTSSFSDNITLSPYGSGNGIKCGLNAIGNFSTDNHVLWSFTTEDKIFKIVPNHYNSLTVSGSLWICTDELYNDSRESFSIELALYEQI